MSEATPNAGGTNRYRWRAIAAAALGAITAVYSLRYAGPLASSMGLVSTLDEMLVQGGAAIASLALWTLLGALLVEGAAARPIRAARAIRCERGVVIAELALVFPVLVVICATLVQLMLIMIALLVVNFAATSAARAATISYERSGVTTHEYPDAFNQQRAFDAACLVLAAISPSTGNAGPLAAGGDDPRNPTAPIPEGGEPIDSMARALSMILGDLPPEYGARTITLRVGYARWGTTVTVEDWVPEYPFQFTSNRDLFPPREVLVTVEYNLFLALNGLAFLPGMTEPLPGGTPGAIFPLTARCLAQSAGTRVPPPGASVGPAPRP